MKMFWERNAVSYQIPVNTPRGSTTAADYSGLHRYGSAVSPAPCLTLTGDIALERVEEVRLREAAIRNALIYGTATDL